MQIRSDAILARLTEKARRRGQDRSRHLLCPACRVRTRLYALKDGRRKCGACGTKFTPEKKADADRLRRHADLLLCFCFGVTARQASAMTGAHYRLASTAYERFRTLLAAQNLMPGKMALLTTVSASGHGVHDSEFCKRCRGRFGCEGRKAGDAPVFGVKILSDGSVFIDPLEEAEAGPRFERGKFSGYAGFICRGKFHRFTDNDRAKDGAERLWAWMSERLRRHHGIWKKNTGLYLKELEWKYNHRALSAEEQAAAIADLLPAELLSTWSNDAIGLDLVRARA